MKPFLAPASVSHSVMLCDGEILADVTRVSGDAAECGDSGDTLLRAIAVIGH